MFCASCQTSMYSQHSSLHALQVEGSCRKDTAKLHSLPDIAFAGFQRKYGDVMAADYMASMVNTVARYRQVRPQLLTSQQSAHDAWPSCDRHRRRWGLLKTPRTAMVACAC